MRGVPTTAPTDVLLHAVNLASRKLSNTTRLDDVLSEVLHICAQATGAEGGTIYFHNKDKNSLEFRHVLPEASASVLKFTDIPDDYGVAGRVFQSRQAETSVMENASPSSISEKTGVVVLNMCTAPLMMEGEEPIGVVQLINKVGGPFDHNDVVVLETIGAVSTLAFLNSMLLQEQTRASQLLGMGRVAHDIKNMAFALEANVSFSDDTVEQAKEHATRIADATMSNYMDDLSLMVGELQGSIDRIKRYAMLMSDLSAGKSLVPTLSVLPMGQTIELASSYMESEARSRGVSMAYQIQPDAPPSAHDEMFLFRIVQNLVSNAIKAVGEHGSTGSVTISYRFDADQHILEVRDTGPGMTEDVAQRILTGNARSVWSKSSGSGWGTKIVLELAKAMDAKVEIDSQPGAGATFRVAFPHVPSVD